MEKQAVTVTIYGNEYTLKGEADPQYIAELAKYVDAKMGEIGKKSSAPAAKVAILVSMNIADELHRLEKGKNENIRLIETLEKNLLEMKKSADGSLKHTLEIKETGDKLKNDNYELRKKLEEATSELLRLKNERDKLKDDTTEARKKLDESAFELLRVKNERDKFKDDSQLTRKKLDESSSELLKLKNEKDKFIQEAFEIRKRLEESQSESTKAKNDLALHFEETEKLKKEFDHGQKRWNDQKVELENAKKRLETSIRKEEDSSKESNRLQNQVQMLGLQIDKLKGDLAAAEGLNDEAQSEIKALNEKMKQLTLEFKQAQENSEKALSTAPHAVQEKTPSTSFLPPPESLHHLFKKIDAILE